MREDLCDKCKEPVPPSNNAAYWDIVYVALKHDQDPEKVLKEVVQDSAKTLFYSARHLYATERCHGSPAKIAAIETKEFGKAAYHFIKNLSGPRKV